jgi:hypothetical protein
MSKVVADQNIQISTRYDDRDLIYGTKQERLLKLSDLLNNEITYCDKDPIKLDRLIERYSSDARAARVDNNMAYFMRYDAAIQRAQIIERSIYSNININF